VLIKLTSSLANYQRQYRATPSPSPERIPTPAPSPKRPLTPPEEVEQKKVHVKQKHDDTNYLGEQQAHALLAAGKTQITPVDFMLQIINDEDPKTSDIKDSTVWGAIYRQCGVWRPPLGVAIFKLHSSELLRRLPPEWKNTSFYAQVKWHTTHSCTAKHAAQQIEAAKQRPARPPRGNPNKHQIKAITPKEWMEEAAEMVPEIKIRSKKNMSSRVDSRGGIAAEATDADVFMGEVNANPPHRQQPVDGTPVEQVVDEQGRSREFNTYIESITSRSADDQAKIDNKSGRGAGKRSTLKPKTLERPAEDEDDAEDSSRRKRSRNGDSSESDSTDGDSPSDQFFHAEQDYTDVISLVQKEGNLTHRPYNHLEQYLKEKAPEYDTAGVPVPPRIQRGWPF
jgi:hypothetical protein